MLNPFTHRKILKKGTPGRATIIAMSMPERGASSQNIPMTLQVSVEGLAPYEVEDQWMVSSKDTLGFGVQLPVRVDPDKPDRVAIDWEAARAEQAEETRQRRESLAAQGPVGGSGAPGTPGATPPPGGTVQDPLAGAAGAAGLGGLGGLAGMMGAGMQAGQGNVEPMIDMRNDPELRAKLEAILGRKLTPGTSERIDTSNDPALAMRIMQAIQQHAAEKASGAAGAAGAEAAQPAAEAGPDDAISKLERLAALHTAGALTDAEFQREKKQLLGEI